ncbi:MAG: hypothetical protein QM757_46800 [Paludibaculum sp.]
MPQAIKEVPVETPQLPAESGDLLPKKLAHARPLFDPQILRRAIIESFVKLNPKVLLKNPVIFVVEAGALITTVLMVRDLATGAGGIGFTVQISLWLWFTVLFANFAEAMAEARGKAQADALRKTKTDSVAKRVKSNGSDGIRARVDAASRRRGDLRRWRHHPWRRGSDRRHRHRG